MIAWRFSDTLGEYYFAATIPGLTSTFDELLKPED